MIIERMYDGSHVLAELADDGCLFHVRYYFYSLEEAKVLFKERLKEFNKAYSKGE